MWGSNFGRGIKFSLLQNFQTGYGGPPNQLFNGNQEFLPGIKQPERGVDQSPTTTAVVNPYPTAFPYGNGMVLHFYQQQESSTTKTVHKVINKGLKTYV